MHSTDGISAVGNRRYNFNAFARYNIPLSWLKGAYIGGGYRHESAPVVGRSNALQIYYGRTRDTVDALIGYTTKVLGGRSTMNLQLNVTNLLDDDYFQPTIVTRANIVQRYQLTTPRTVRLSASFEF